MKFIIRTDTELFCDMRRSIIKIRKASSTEEAFPELKNTEVT